MAEGIDVSKYQGTVNWLEVKNSGREFAVARSSIGQGTIDETFVTNYTRMRNRGLIPGAYHLVTGTSSGAEQAANWKRQLDAAGFDKGLLVLDVEGWSETLNGNEAGTLKATEYLCQWVRDTYKRTPIIYTGVYWRENLKQHPDNFGSRLWLSYYGTNDPQNYVPSAWNTWKIWQYSSTGSVPGVTGNCDLNKSAGTYRSMQTLAGWEWDELATQEEIKNLLTAEGDRIIAAAKASDLASAKQVIDAVNTVGAAGATRDAEVITKLTEVLAALTAETTVDVDFTPLYDIVEDLHRHVCTRTDLHM